MFDLDVVIIGGGPAGLTAGLYLSRAKRNVILLERDLFGGPIMNFEWIENYPGFAEGVSGAQLASEMVNQATKFGLKLEIGEVEGIEFFTNGRYVKCAGGTGYMTKVVIIAGGSHHKKLSVPGEEKLQGKGIFNCALCDGGKFADGIVAVCGGGDAGLTEALYMSKLASKVIVLEAMQTLTASAILQDRAKANPKLEIHCRTKVTSIVGDSQVEGVELLKPGGEKETLKVNGLLVHIGLEPNTAYLNDSVPLDSGGSVKVNGKMETEVPYIFAAGDIRSGTRNQIVTAVGDGAMAAISAERLLQEQA